MEMWLNKRVQTEYRVMSINTILQQYNMLSHTAYHTGSEWSTYCGSGISWVKWRTSWLVLLDHWRQINTVLSLKVESSSWRCSGVNRCNTGCWWWTAGWILRVGESVSQVPDPASQRASVGSFVVAVQFWGSQRLKQPTWEIKEELSVFRTRVCYSGDFTLYWSHTVNFDLTAGSCAVRLQWKTGCYTTLNPPCPLSWLWVVVLEDEIWSVWTARTRLQ